MTINNIARNQMAESMMRVASGNRINSAADDAAGLAIVESMTSQIRGLDQGTRNTRDMQSLVRTAEGGLDTVNDSLQRIRELSVQASNGILTPANREMIQQEISQLADGIQSAIGGGVQFNTINLLDGSAANLNTASAPDGTGATVSINDMTALAQAVANYNVTGAFDMGEIDQAIGEVTSQRSALGAWSNRFDFTASANTISSLNLADARSRIQDADIAREMMALHQARVLQEMELQMQRNQRDEEENQLNRVMAAGALR